MKSLFAATLILALGCFIPLATTLSQVRSGDEGNDAEASPQAESTQVGDDTVVKDVAAKDAVGQNASTAQSLISASSLQGATLLGKDGNSVGTVARIALDAVARNVHLVVNVGGVLGIGAREIAIPLAAVHLRSSKDPEDTAVWLGVEATSEQLDKAPSLEARDSLELTDAAWVQKNAQYYGLNQQPTTPLQNQAEKLTILTAEQILNQPVLGKGDTATIATVENILFGFADNAIEYAILSYGGTLGLGKKYVAIPFRQLTINQRDENGIELVIPHNSKTLAEQQHVTPSDYPELKLRSVRLRIEQ